VECDRVSADQEVPSSRFVQRGKQTSEVGIDRHGALAIPLIPAPCPRRAQDAQPAGRSPRTRGRTTYRCRAAPRCDSSPWISADGGSSVHSTAAGPLGILRSGNLGRMAPRHPAPAGAKAHPAMRRGRTWKRPRGFAVGPSPAATQELAIIHTDVILVPASAAMHKRQWDTVLYEIAEGQSGDFGRWVPEGKGESVLQYIGHYAQRPCECNSTARQS